MLVIMVVVISGVFKFYKSVIMIPTRNIISQLKISRK